MCIIVYCPKGKRLPSKNILENCWDANDDGAGIMYFEEGKVIGEKGFMEFDDLWYRLKADKRLFKDTDLVIHFRTGTHGGITPEATHPFPLPANKKSINDLIWTSNIGCAHNGIISGYGKSIYLDPKVKEDKKAHLSDTQDFILKVLNNKEIIENIDNPGVAELIKKMTNSKWIILKGGDVYKIGDFIEDDGIFYSNTGYLDYVGFKYWEKDDPRNDVLDTKKVYKEYCEPGVDCPDCPYCENNANYGGDYCTVYNTYIDE